MARGPAIGTQIDPVPADSVGQRSHPGTFSAVQNSYANTSSSVLPAHDASGSEYFARHGVPKLSPISNTGFQDAMALSGMGGNILHSNAAELLDFQQKLSAAHASGRFVAAQVSVLNDRQQIEQTVLARQSIPLAQPGMRAAKLARDGSKASPDGDRRGSDDCVLGLPTQSPPAVAVNGEVIMFDPKVKSRVQRRSTKKGKGKVVHGKTKAIASSGVLFAVKSRKRKRPGHDSTTTSRVASPAQRKALRRTSLHTCSPNSIAQGDEHVEDNQSVGLSVFRINDKAALDLFYDETFSQMQQLTLKSVLKAWIKELEPKKSRKHPYCKPGGSRPAFWPERVEHREPDHLKKAPRHMLARSILKWVMHINRGAFDAGSIARLRQSTIGVRMQFDRESESKVARRRRLLEQLYHVAEMEEQVLADQIDGDAQVSLQEPLLSHRPQRKSKKANRSQTLEVRDPSRENSFDDVVQDHHSMFYPPDEKTVPNTPQMLRAETPLNLHRKAPEQPQMAFERVIEMETQCQQMAGSPESLRPNLHSMKDDAKPALERSMAVQSLADSQLQRFPHGLPMQGSFHKPFQPGPWYATNPATGQLSSFTEGLPSAGHLQRNHFYPESNFTAPMDWVQLPTPHSMPQTFFSPATSFGSVDEHGNTFGTKFPHPSLPSSQCAIAPTHSAIAAPDTQMRHHFPIDARQFSFTWQWPQAQQ